MSRRNQYTVQCFNGALGFRMFRASETFFFFFKFIYDKTYDDGRHAAVPFARRSVPRAAVLLRVSQAVHVAVVVGRVAGKLVPRDVAPVQVLQTVELAVGGSRVGRGGVHLAALLAHVRQALHFAGVRGHLGGQREPGLDGELKAIQVAVFRGHRGPLTDLPQLGFCNIHTRYVRVGQ